MISTVKYPYDDTVVLVTGAGDGIGRAVAQAFAEQGARVVGLGRHVETVTDALSGFDADKTLALQADVSSRTDVEAAVAAAVERFGRLDVVVPNAAVFETPDLDDLTDEQWHLMQSVNVDGLFYVLRATVPHLKASRGNVVAISSVSGMRGDWGQFAYNATKGAGVTMLQSLALDLGPDGVRVNLVAPALTVTRITEGMTKTPGFDDAIRPTVSRSGAPASPRTSPGRSCSWPARTPRTSPAPCCPSTAARPRPPARSTPESRPRGPSVAYTEATSGVTTGRDPGRPGREGVAVAARRRAVERAALRRTAIDRVVTGVLVVVAAAGLMSVLPGSSQRAVSRTSCQVATLGLGACGDPGLDLADVALAPPRCLTLAALDDALPEVRVRRLVAARRTGRHHQHGPLGRRRRPAGRRPPASAACRAHR